MIQRLRLRSAAGVGAVLLLALLAALALVLFSSAMTRESVNRTRVWSTALADLREHVTLHHLWLEEAVGGDATVDIPNEVYGNLAAAGADCRALLDGGHSSRRGLKVVRLDDAGGRAALRSACRQLPALQRLGRTRLAARNSTNDGTGPDTAFDARLETFVAGVSKALNQVSRRSAADGARLGRINYGTAALLVLLFGGLAVVLRSSRRQSDALHRRDARDLADERAQAEYRQRQVEFSKTVQGSRSEREVDLLVKRFLEATLPATTATTLRRNNSADRLEATTPIDPESPLVTGVVGAAPDSCAAVRTASAHTREEGREPLLLCDICGCLPGPSTCLPSLVGGEVVGSVLVERAAPLSEDDERHLEETVNQSAPVIANLRNLARAERQAATDQLTGLPNRRAVDDALERMLAHAQRNDRPFSLVLFDLDHFKRINDSFGHAEGDRVLAAVAAAAEWAARTEDFVARAGGEEFTVLLPDTDATGALAVCERLRSAIRQVRVSGNGREVTASFGIADFPAIATDSENLLRAADRALYSAKENGRDRIETASSTLEVTDLDFMAT